jgi:hypothetical protein
MEAVMGEPRYILIAGGRGHGKNAFMEALMREKYGKDIVLVTPEEAKEQGLRMEDIANVPTMRIEAPPMQNLPVPLGAVKDGKARRRERRKAERRARKR